VRRSPSLREPGQPRQGEKERQKKKGETLRGSAGGWDGRVEEGPASSAWPLPPINEHTSLLQGNWGRMRGEDRPDAAPSARGEHRMQQPLKQLRPSWTQCGRASGQEAKSASSGSYTLNPQP
jgi:hypothetical protein